jgi:hypothetical protein
MEANEPLKKVWCGVQYTMGQIEKIIVKCPTCRQKLRIPLLSQKVLVVKCPKGCREFKFDPEKFKYQRQIIRRLPLILASLILVIDLVLPFTITSVVNNDQKITYDKKIKQTEDIYSLQETNLKIKYDKEVGAINKDELQKLAELHYSKEWEERKNYDNKYAITPREKAQLEMLALSKDKSRPMEDIVRNLVAKAAPENSEISVYTTPNGFILDINFDMSALSSGEQGATTRHRDLGSLKNEVRRLIGKVTNDVYQFSQDINLESIKIGCKHLVNLTNQGSNNTAYMEQENIVIYKVELKKINFKELKHNPFLDIYSTEKYLNVIKDEFATLRLSSPK